MRSIDKSKVNQSLINQLETEYRKWKKSKKLSPFDRLSSPGNPLKEDLKNSLIKEQGGLCCYCESVLAENFHIEHLLPQREYPDRGLDYNNLLCSCQKEMPPKEQRHCGMSKGDKILKITPLDQDCSSHFRYQLDGKVEPANENDNAAKETIDILQLNNPLLSKRRYAAIRRFLLETNQLSQREILKRIDAYGARSTVENPHPFISAIESLKSLIQ